MRGYTVPDQADGHPTICFQMELPNAPEYRQAILGQISHLFRWYAWERTGSRAGAETAEVLKQYALTMQFIDDCQQAGIDVIFRQTECTLEASMDNGQTWTVIFDANPCKPTLIYNAGDIIYDGVVIVDGDTIYNDVTIPPDTEHIHPDGINKRCNLASYLIDMPLPDLAEKLYTQKDEATANNTSLVFLLLSVGAIVVTGGLALGAIPAISAGLALGGIAGAGAYNVMAAALELIDTATARAEQTAQYWQDVKCTIYCHLGNDAILDDETMIAIADAIATDITPTYPNAGPVMEAIFRTTSPEARGKWQIYGSLYDGSNCDLCACSPWYTVSFNGQIDVLGEPTAPWYSKYFEFVGNSAYSEAIQAMVDAAPQPEYQRIEIILDLSKTPAIITGWAIDGRTDGSRWQFDNLPRAATLEAWDETTQSWTFVYQSAGSYLGLNSFPGTLQQLPSPTTKLRLVQEGWDANVTRVRYFKVQGTGIDPFVLQWSKEGLI